MNNEILEKKDDMAQQLKDHRLKATSQRIAVLSILKESKDHPSAEMVMDKLRQRGIHMSFATVYNVLETFVEAGLVAKLAGCDEIMRFDYNTDFHIHLYDSDTGAIRDHIDETFCEYLSDYVKNHLALTKNIEKIDLFVQIKN